MKKYIVLLLVIILSMPIKFGEMRYRNTCDTIALKMRLDKNFGGDLDIEMELVKNGFNLGFMDKPTIKDYYISGINWIWNY
jgi:hypothetical protein